MEPLDATSLDIVTASLAETTLNEKHSTSVVEVLGDPCSPVKRGMITMGFKMRNTAEPLAALMIKLLERLPADRVAEVWSLIPAEPRTWTLRAFINSLPCRIAPGASQCDEESTNTILGKFEDARFEFTQKRLALAGMDPFPSTSSPKSGRSESTAEDSSMEKYVKGLGMSEDPASAWVLSQFDQTEGDEEPEWFRGIASKCSGHAHSHIPDVKDANEAAELSDLDAATRVAVWAWHYKDCHKTHLLAAYQKHSQQKQGDDEL